MILRRTPPGSLDSIDWDSIRIKTGARILSRYTELICPILRLHRRRGEPRISGGDMLEDILECLAQTVDNPENGQKDLKGMRTARSPPKAVTNDTDSAFEACAAALRHNVKNRRKSRWNHGSETENHRHMNQKQQCHRRRARTRPL